MKKLMGALLLCLVIYVIHFDLTVGTLPPSTFQQTKAVQTDKTALPYFETMVKPGDTVITIVEHHLNKPLPVSIHNLVTDFRKLNSKLTSDQIQIGKTYKFPDYHR